jgi:hypothetical protein
MKKISVNFSNGERGFVDLSRAPSQLPYRSVRAARKDEKATPTVPSKRKSILERFRAWWKGV